jgi:hypothetical protein
MAYSFKINANGLSEEFILSKVAQHISVPEGISWQLEGDVLYPIDGDWLKGTPATLALIQERIIVLQTFVNNTRSTLELMDWGSNDL